MLINECLEGQRISSPVDSALRLWLQKDRPCLDMECVFVSLLRDWISLFSVMRDDKPGFMLP